MSGFERGDPLDRKLCINCQRMHSSVDSVAEDLKFQNRNETAGHAKVEQREEKPRGGETKRDGKVSNGIAMHG